MIKHVNILTTSDGAKSRIAALISTAFITSLKPPPKLNLVEWADKYRYLPDNSAEPGRWKTDRVEPARQPMLSASDPHVQEITIMSCIQLMKTELMINIALYFVHQEPSPLMYVAPKKELGEAWSKERFVKSCKATPVVRDIFADNRRGEGNTILQKQFPGGQLSVVSARNPDDLAMRACRVMMFDECDKYPANTGAGDGGSGGEGDPMAVAWGRATTYGKRAKKITACSPTVQGKSRIEQEYLKSNQGVYHQPCKHCGFAKELTWLDVVIPHDPDTGEMMHEQSHILCDSDNGGCGTVWTEGDRLWSIRNGFWHIKKPKVTWHHGYKVTSLASPFTPVITLAKEFMDALGNSQLLKAFYNTRMAQTWKEIGDQPDWQRLYDRREHYSVDRVPEGVLMITCGIDVQKLGIFFEYTGWGRRKENWSLDKGYIAGDIESDEMKEQIYAIVDRMWKSHTGVNIPTERTCLDSGYRTQRCYAIVREYVGEKLVAVKGEKEGNLKTILGTPTPVDVNINGVRHSRGLMLWKVGSSVTKEQIYSWLNLEKPTDEKLKEGKLYPSGYCHFPEYDEEYFKQITAEQYLRVENKRGFVQYVWDKTRKDNHFLDCRVYSRAGAAMLQIDRMTENDWIDRELVYCPVQQKIDSTEPNHDTNDYNERPARGVRKGKWIKRK
ncbi:terminase large subunit [Shewanella sp. phage 1/44]|uniref:terminase large subunit n=1 Tax=Shewanella sp. phage 1/44 TaxID=1458862 RepID=UPI0004F6CB25|nr:terminase large subunit [Shewanella sp. phage 1/44]AHK11735.1 terminase large subunit [Shewanella sp. phage 1/44]